MFARTKIALAAAVVVATVVASIRAAEPAGQVLFRPSAEDVKKLDAADGQCRAVERDGQTWLDFKPTGDKPAELTIAAPKGEWDLSSVEALALSLRNPGKSPITVRLAAYNPDAKDLADACHNAVELMPGESKDVLFRLTRRPQDPTFAPFKDFYMYVKSINVRDNTIDPAHVTKLTIGLGGLDPSGGVLVSAIGTSGQGKAEPPPFFPFIDGYGQYTHSDWPGKIYSDGDFAARREQEAREQKDWPQPADWDEYGGWAKGPTLKATGFFHPAKHGGQWWLVDPAGKLFWSYGPTGVGFGGDASPITDRQDWFTTLPAQDDPAFGQFFRKGHGAMFKYYANKDWVGYDVQRANLFRKYGADYQKIVPQTCIDRLHSWGFNTIGNWSDPTVCQLKKTPYVVAINSPSVSVMKWTDGHMFQDVYDPKWEPGLFATMKRQVGTTAGDPWCLGYFVDNERCVGWRPRGAAVGEIALKAPAQQPAKIKFIELLKKKYPDIDKLNDAWHTKYESWDGLQNSQDAPALKDNAVLTADCGDFGMMFCERYFSVSRDAVKSVAPNNLFLGSRFYGHTDPELVKLATKYWDVISYNIYDMPPDGRVNEYKAIDFPILCTEWGIGSDPMQTPFRGDKPNPRGKEMANYVEHAIRLPNLVGAHFFQFRDQPLSGRSDGEATLRGFVNVADTPNFELVQANRKVAYHLYETRAGAK